MSKQRENEKEIDNWYKETNKYDIIAIIIITTGLLIFILSRLIIITFNIIEGILWSIYITTLILSEYIYGNSSYETEDKYIIFDKKLFNKAKYLLILPLITLTIITIVNFGQYTKPYGCC